MPEKESNRKSSEGSKFLKDVSDIENSPGEVLPEDMHDYVLEVVKNMTELTGKDGLTVADKVIAAESVHRIYLTVLGKSFAKEVIDKTDRTNNRAIDQVKKLRRDGKQPYEDDED